MSNITGSRENVEREREKKRVLVWRTALEGGGRGEHEDLSLSRWPNKQPRKKKATVKKRIKKKNRDRKFLHFCSRCRTRGEKREKKGRCPRQLGRKVGVKVSLGKGKGEVLGIGEPSRIDAPFS